MKTIKFLSLLTAFLFIFIGFSSYSVVEGATSHFTGFKATPDFCAYAGKVTIDGNNAIDGDDEVGVFVSDGSGGEIIIGAAVMGETIEGHYFVTIYGNDTTTPVKDGAYANDTLIFKVWKKSTNTEYTIPESSMTYEAFAGLTGPQIPPIFVKGETYGLLNLAAVSEPGSITGTIAYTGSATGTILIGAATDEDMNNIVGSTTIPSPGVFTISDLAPGAYYVGAFMDATGHGLNEPQAGDPENMVETPVTVPSGGEVNVGTLTLLNSPAKLVFINDPLNIGVGVKGTMTVQVQDIDDNPVVAPEGGVVALSTTSTGGKFFDATGVTEITSVTIPAGSHSASFQYYDEEIGTPTITGANPYVDNAAQQAAISAGAPVRLAVSPDTAALTAGQAQQFTVTAYDFFDNVVPAGTVNWSVLDGIGSIDTNGVFTATTVGTGRIQAEAGGLSATNTEVVVTAGALASFVVSPNTATLTADETLQFTVTNGKDAYDNDVAEIGTVSWSVNDGIGTIDADGLFTAITVGTGSITATKNDISATSGAVTVTPGAANAIVLSSNKTMIVNNGTDFAQISGTIVDQNANIVTDYDANDVTFTVDNTDLATFAGNPTGTVPAANIVNGVATINLNSVETAQIGQVQITAASGALTQVAPLNIQVINKILVSISIETTAGGLVNNTSPRVGETVQLKATGHYRLPGEDVDPALDENITNVVTWNSSVPAKGTVSNVGLFTALEEGATNVTGTMDTITSNTIAMNVQAAAAVVIDDTDLPTTIVPGTEIDFGPVTSGGTGAGFIYAIDSQPAGNRGTITAEGKFNVATTGAFAGVYVISVTDVNSGASTTYQVTVPLQISQTRNNLMTGQSLEIVVSGAAPGAQIGRQSELLDENDNPLPDEEIDETMSFAPAPPFVFDGDSKATIEITAKKVTNVVMFKAQLVVEGDPALTADNGLNQITSGWIRILPGVTYSGLVQDEGGVPIGGAKVLFTIAGKVIEDDTAEANGSFEVTVLSPSVTGSEYNVSVSAAGFLSRTDITTEGWENPEIIELTPEPAEGETVTGTVTELAGPIAGAMVACNVDGTIFFTMTEADGTYTLFLPTDDTAGLKIRASKDGYLAEQKAFAATVNFELVPVDPADPADVTVGEDGGSFTKGDVRVDISAGALPANSILTITPLPVGEGTSWTQNSVSLFLIEIRDAVTGDPVDLQEPIQITIPFDTSKVNPGDFRNGIAVVYHADDLAALEAGLGTPVPASDIIYQDDAAGEVTFWVYDLSVFGIGIAFPAVGDQDAVLSGSSGCFIDTTTRGLKPDVGFLMMLGLLLGGAVFSRVFVRTARK